MVQSVSPTPPTPQQGEIWYVRIPNQPNDPHQTRTAIVLSTTTRNRLAGDVIVVPTSSAITKPHREYHVHIPAGEGGLKKDSYAKCEQVTTIDKSLLANGPLGAPIHYSYRQAIVDGIRAALGDPRV
jgi:mRNA interferase MazF